MNKSETQVQNLLFLLSAAPMAIGCIITTSDDDGATTTPSTTTGSTTENPSTGSAMTTANPTTAADPTTGELEDESSADGADGADGESTAAETGGDVPEVCVSYVDKVLECYPDEMVDATTEYCIMIYDMFAAAGDDCLAAWETFTVCLSALPCENFTDEDDTSCEKEEAAIEKVCPPA